MFQNKKPKSLSFYYALHFISPFKTFCLQILGVILNSILSSYLGCHPFLSVLRWYCTVFFSSKFFLFPCISQGFYPDINNTVSCSLVSNSLWLHGLQPARLFCPWNSPGKNTGVCNHPLLQGIFPVQGLNAGLLHCR